MSRRKQANPRPLKELEEEVKPNKEEETNRAKYAMLVEDVIPDDPDSDQDLATDGFDEYGPLVVDTSGHEHDDDDGKDNEDRLDPVFLSSLGQTHENVQHRNSEPGIRSNGFLEQENKTVLDSFTNSDSNLSGSLAPSISPSEDQIPRDSSLTGTSKNHNRRGNKILPVATDKGDSRYICPICQEVLATDHDLTVHIRTHNNNNNSNQTNSCTICGKLLSSQSSLDRHMLVHSGERPFKCKICKMSFTTNGNMHRHSRIHAKETDVNSVGNKSNQRRKNSWKPKIHFYVPPNSSTPEANLPVQHISGEVTPDFKTQSFTYGETSTPNEKVFPGVKRTFNFVDCSPDWSLPSAKRHYFGPNFSSELSKHLKGEISLESKDLAGAGKILPFQSHQTEQLLATKLQNSNSFPLQDHRPNKDKENLLNVPGQQNNQQSADEDKETDQLHCPVCNKAFLCKYGLETHMETHPESSLKCYLCHMSFPTRRGLSMHRLLVHSKSKSSESEEEKAAVVGFYDLSFIDFAVKKFSLVAKSWCEDNSRKSSSAYHNFVCKECMKAFPCKSALILHQHTHTPEKTAQCPLCECDFMDSQQLHVHMVKHISDKAFDDLQQQTSADKENLDPQNMCQQDFLGMVGLTTTKEYGTGKSPIKEEKGKKKESSILNVEKSENNDYFAKLGQVFSSTVPPIHPFFKQADEMPKNFAEFQKMLQTAAAQGLMPMQSQMGALFPGMEHLAQMNPSQFAAFMPSMFPFGLAPNMPGFSAMAAAMMTNASMMHALSNHNLSSPLPTPPPSSDGGSGGSGSSGDMADQKCSFPCKYCDMVFPNYRMLKGHTRTHLGLSPYKCNLCSYSSADKSTLIRHLRTHNGERPFQCRVCDFAFTTKANCERHVRKKHGKNSKDDIEGAIGYNKYVIDSSNAVDSFHSPDTVCKYCGVDFKFFRALKHHLRSHSSCRQKPFMCTRCDVGFSSKANCVRHLQKQHSEISQNQIESYIHVNEPALAMDDGENSTGDSVSDDGYPLDTSGRGIDGQSLLAEKLAPPPAAHSTPRMSITPTDSRQGSPLLMKKEPVFIKSEPVESLDDKPLDFSVKQNEMAAKHNGDLDVKHSEGTDEIPMDLTMKKSDSSSSLSSKSSKASHHSKVHYDSNHFQCQFCPMGFSTYRLLDRHMWHHHTNLAGMLEAKPLFTPGYHPSLSSDLPTLGGNLKLPLKPPVSYDQNQSKSELASMKRSDLLSKLPNILQKKKNRDVGSPVNNFMSGSDSSSDLASVKKMLDATHPHKFKAFFNESMADSDISSQGDDRTFDDSRLDDPDMPEISESESGLSIHQDASNEPPVLSPSARGDNDSSDGKCDEDMPEIMNQVRELVKHVDKFKNESRSSTPRSLESLDSKNLLKKKRNSYADSPHKLSCPYCTRTFPWVSSLTRHLLTHTGQKPFKCPRCPVTFSTKSNRERHLIRKHGVNMLDPLSRQTMDRPYKCHLCVFSSFSTQGNLLKHYKERHAGCTLPKSLADLDKAVTVGLSRNARESPLTDAEKMEEQAMMNMDDSLENSMTRSELDQLDRSMEYERSDDRFILDLKDEDEEDEMMEDENQSPPKTEDIMKPFCTKTEEQPITPDLKAVQLSAEMAKLNEMRMNAINAEIKINELRQQQNELRQQHIFNVPDIEQVKPFAGTGERQINPERDNYNVDKITECWKCTEKFSSRKLLVRHLKEHNIDLPFKCYLCDASYETRKECLLHQEKFHTSDWNILKDKNKVDTIESFSQHMDKVVENNINKVDTGAMLEIPGQSIDDPKMEVVSADYMQRKVYCSLCPKRFWSLQDLRRHMRSHTGERPFECDICQKRFTLKHSMMRHRKKHMESGSLSPSDDEDNSQTEDLAKSGSNKAMTKLPLPPLVPSSVPISLNTSMNGEVHGESRGRYGTTASTSMSSMGSQPTIIKVDSKDSNDNSADILHNLLGVDATSIDKMLDSADTASFMLGFNA